jgi:hypothetical protein
MPNLINNISYKNLTYLDIGVEKITIHRAPIVKKTQGFISSGKKLEGRIVCHRHYLHWLIRRCRIHNMFLRFRSFQSDYRCDQQSYID